MKILRHIRARGRGPDSTGPLADVESQIVEERNRRAMAVLRGACVSEGASRLFACLQPLRKAMSAKSRIVFSLNARQIQSTIRMDQMYVMTEFDMVNLKGSSVAEHAQGPFPSYTLISAQPWTRSAHV